MDIEEHGVIHLHNACSATEIKIKHHRKALMKKMHHSGTLAITPQDTVVQDTGMDV